MCHHMDGAYTEWYEEVAADEDDGEPAGTDEEPPEVDIGEPEIGEPDIEEPEIDEPELEADD